MIGFDFFLRINMCKTKKHIDSLEGKERVMKKFLIWVGTGMLIWFLMVGCVKLIQLNNDANEASIMHTYEYEKPAVEATEADRLEAKKVEKKAEMKAEGKKAGKKVIKKIVHVEDKEIVGTEL